MTYTPTVNDYVKWTTALGMVHEGRVYYKSTPLDNVFRKKMDGGRLTLTLPLRSQQNQDRNVTYQLSYIKEYMYAYVAQRVVGMNWS